MTEKDAVAVVKKEIPDCSVTGITKVKSGFVISCEKIVNGESSIIQPMLVFGNKQIRGLNGNYAPDKKILNEVYPKK